MLRITIPESEEWDEVNERFVYIKEQTLDLEHSLLSVRKWESKWHTPFLDKKEKTADQVIDYVKCMSLNKKTDPNVYLRLTANNIDEINNYINNPMTATWFAESKKKSRNKEVITAEKIYYWMVALNIPFECQKWHLNSLLTLIRVCEEENKPKKKMSRKALMARNSELNAARRKMLKSKG